MNALITVIEQVIASLKSVYKSVDDVDFFVGGLLEVPLNDALMGYTFVCVVGDQFVRLKKADRYFYSLTNQPHSFSSRKTACRFVYIVPKLFNVE